MFGPEYFTVAAYENDGTILCRKCGDKAGLPASDQLMQSEFNEGDWDTGCYCDDCGAEIVAPYESEDEDDEESEDEDETSKSSSIIRSYKDGVCPDCGLKIPLEVVSGQECQNCGHVFVMPHPSDDED